MDAATAFPPSYAGATGQHSALCGELTFVDFVPQCIDQGGHFTKAVFEPFNVLIDRANAWLRQTPNWEAKTCESVEFKNKYNEINYEKMTYLDYGTCYYIRALRLWIVPHHDPSRPPQQIGYVNVVPQELPDSGLETLDLILDRFNKVLQSQPIPGRILTVETQEMKMPSISAFDPDKSLWLEVQYSHKFIFVIRVFYEVSAPANEVIGIASFVPRTLREGGLFSAPVLEPFSNVIRDAFQWCSQQTGIRFCNAQSVEIKMKTGFVIDTQRMLYTEHGGKRRTYYVRILRLAYTKSLPNSMGYMPSNVPVLNLTYKTFVPVQVVSRTFQVSEFETLSQTKQRVVAWVKATGARVVSAETCAVRIFLGDCSGHDSSLTYTTGEHAEHWIFIIRLYLDGFYPEPPPELLPPLPAAQKNDCCLVM